MGMFVKRGRKGEESVLIEFWERGKGRERGENKGSDKREVIEGSGNEGKSRGMGVIGKGVRGGREDREGE